jgi:hypothetical protein
MSALGELADIYADFSACPLSANSGHCSVLVRAVFGHRAEGLNVPHSDKGMRVYVVAYDTTKPTQITIAASAKPTTAEVHMLSS